jgi:hypothetical protein
LGTHSVAPHASSEAGPAFVHGRRTCRQRALLSVSSPADSLPCRSPPPAGRSMARSATLSGPCLRGCAQSSGPGLWRWRSCAFSFGVSGWTGAELKWRSRFVAGSSLRFQHRLASSHRSGERALRKERAAVFGEAHLLLLAPLKGWLAPPSVAGVHAEVPRVVFVAAADDCVLLA